mmetsp:Transcript_27256/g.48973  ORF Transcript_27256/g.48973 Transcript_27256/m.48973 type:complete len:188 (-) Transcript_27256:799-1362(-)
MQVRQLTPSAKRSLHKLFSINKCTIDNFLLDRPESPLARAARSVSKSPETPSLKRPRPKSRLVRCLAQKVLAADTKHMSHVKLEKNLVLRESIEKNQDWRLEHRLSLIRSLLGTTVKSPTVDSPKSTPKYTRINIRRSPVVPRVQSKRELRRTQTSQSNSSFSEGNPWLKPRYIPEQAPPKRLSPMR